MRFRKQKSPNGPRAARLLIVAACFAPMLAGSDCTGPRGDQIRTDVASALSTLLGSLGDLAGAFFSSLIRPLPETEAPEPALQ